MLSESDRNSLAYWFPLIEQAGLPVPRTATVTAPGDLTCLLDGERPIGWSVFIDTLRKAAASVGWPCFLRTGHGAGKHEWSRTCYLSGPDDLPGHVSALVEWSHLVDMMGLPTDVWVAREMIPTRSLFRAFYGFPVTREFRFFIRDGTLEHWQPYWPADAIERPDDPAWRTLLHTASRINNGELGTLAALAARATKAVGGGYWSVDFLQDIRGCWWLTDMALGDQSFRYDYAAVADASR